MLHGMAGQSLLNLLLHASSSLGVHAKFSAGLWTPCLPGAQRRCECFPIAAQYLAQALLAPPNPSWLLPRPARTELCTV